MTAGGDGRASSSSHTAVIVGPAADPNTAWKQVAATSDSASRPGNDSDLASQSTIMVDGRPIDVAGSSIPLQRFRGAGRVEDISRQLREWNLSSTSAQREARFVLRGKLGAGSQGVIYRVLDRDCRREIAFKSIYEEGCDVGDISRFIHEAQITAQLEHPGIVPVHDFGVLPDGTVFYTMKRIDGGSLAKWLETRAGRGEHRFEMLNLFLKVCEAVAFAHHRGVLHRDLKPRNIMVGRYGEVLVMDWGLAKVMGPSNQPASTRISSLRTDHEGDERSSDVHRTMDGFAVGTPAYMSPEQARGETEHADPRSDVYSLGVILFEMLTGRSPYVRGDVRSTLTQVANGKAERLGRFALTGEGGSTLAAIIAKSMALEPAARYATVDQLADDLRNHLAGLAVSAYRETPVESLARLMRRHRRPLLAASLVAVLAGLCMLGWWGWLKREVRLEVDGLRLEARRLEASGDLEGARAALQRILAHYRDDEAAVLGAARLGAVIAKALDLEQERRQRQEAAELRATARAAEERDDEAGLASAVEYYMRAMGLTPGDGELLADYQAVVAKRAVRDQQRKQREADGERLRAAAELSSSAIAARDQGRLSDAIGLMTGAAALHPTSESSQQLIRLGALREGQEREELKAQRRREAERKLQESEAALAAGKAGEAMALLDQAKALDPEHPRLEGSVARVQEALRGERRLAQEREAEGLLATARMAMDAGGRLDLRLQELERERRAREGSLFESGSAEARVALHELEQQMAMVGEERSTALSSAIALLHQANAKASDHPPVRKALAAYYVARLLEAEAAGDQAEAAAAEAQGRIFDDGEHRDVLAGQAQVEVADGSSPITLRRLVEQPDRSDGPVEQSLALRPGAAATVGHGRYLATNAHGVQAAYRCERGRVCRIDLPPPPTLPPGTVAIPAGVVYSADGRVQGKVAGFILQIKEVTCGEYLEFINDPGTRRVFADEWAKGNLVLVPREGVGNSQPLWRQLGVVGWRRAGGEFMLETSGGERIDPATPVSDISHEDAEAYARWRAARERVAWRLPLVLEWQLAAQGGDGRAYPWGNRADPSLCNSGVAPATAKRAGPSTIVGGSFPKDRSVQGVFDLAGSLAEFVDGGPVSDPRLGILMGGNRSDRQPERFCTWSRREAGLRFAFPNCGFRLAASH